VNTPTVKWCCDNCKRVVHAGKQPPEWAEFTLKNVAVQWDKWDLCESCCSALFHAVKRRRQIERGAVEEVVVMEHNLPSQENADAAVPKDLRV